MSLKWSFQPVIKYDTCSQIIQTVSSTKNHNHTRRSSYSFWLWCLSIATDFHRELIFSSRLERRHIMCSINGSYHFQHSRTCVSVIHGRGIDNLCAAYWPWYSHTCLCDAGNACRRRLGRIYRQSQQQNCTHFRHPIQDIALNSRTGTEGPPVYCLNCDRPLHSD